MAEKKTSKTVPPNGVEEEGEPDITVKCVTIGDTAVGKTCVLITYAKNKFPVDYVPTVFETYEAVVDVNGKPVKFELWDTAGSEQLDVLRPLSYDNTDVFLVVYSVIEKESFKNVEAKWIKDIKDKGAKGIPYIIVGNKVDLRTEKYDPDKCVSKEELEKLKQNVQAAACFEVSALKQEGIKAVFDQCIKIAFQMRREKEAAAQVTTERGCNCVVV